MKFIAFLVFLTLTSPCLAEQVCSVHDGDTFTLCSGQKVRIWGIDAPELSQPMGEVSASYLKSLINGKDVELEQRGKSYKRAVCKVRLDGQDVGSAMAVHGMGYDYARYSAGYYAQYEREAQRRGLGVWQSLQFQERPWEYRHKSR